MKSSAHDLQLIKMYDQKTTPSGNINNHTVNLLTFHTDDSL